MSTITITQTQFELAMSALTWAQLNYNADEIRDFMVQLETYSAQRGDAKSDDNDSDTVMRDAPVLAAIPMSSLLIEELD